MCSPVEENRLHPRVEGGEIPFTAEVTDEGDRNAPRGSDLALPVSGEVLRTSYNPIRSNSSSRFQLASAGTDAKGATRSVSVTHRARPRVGLKRRSEDGHVP